LVVDSTTAEGVQFVQFVEHWFHTSPDGGNGGFEVLVLVLFAAILTLLARRGAFRQRQRS
jgi:hypothetical protein